MTNNYKGSPLNLIVIKKVKKSRLYFCVLSICFIYLTLKFHKKKDKNKINGYFEKLLRTLFQISMIYIFFPLSLLINILHFEFFFFN